jgi:drug/metabolite transporter (DMT)-like permease
LEIISFGLALSAGVNQGVIATLFTLSAVSSALLTFIFLGEKIGLNDGIGMLFVLACAVLLSFSQDKAENDGKLKV